MPISKFLPVALMVAALATSWVVIGSRMNLVLWVPFISWALFFMAGAKYSRLHKEVIGLTGGAVFAVVLLWLLPTFSNIFGAAWGLPVLVFLAAFLIVLLEVTDWLELAPAYFFSFAAFFAFWFGKFAGSTAGVGPDILAWGPIVNFWFLLMIGLGYGALTQLFRDKILDFLKVPKEQRQTIFDKEKKVA